MGRLHGLNCIGKWVGDKILNKACPQPEEMRTLQVITYLSGYHAYFRLSRTLQINYYAYLTPSRTLHIIMHTPDWKTVV